MAFCAIPSNRTNSSWYDDLEEPRWVKAPRRCQTGHRLWLTPPSWAFGSLVIRMHCSVTRTQVAKAASSALAAGANRLGQSHAVCSTKSLWWRRCAHCWLHLQHGQRPATEEPWQRRRYRVSQPLVHPSSEREKHSRMVCRGNQKRARAALTQ